MLGAGPLTALLAAAFAVLPAVVVLVRAFRILVSPRDSTLPARFLAFRAGVGGAGTAGAALLVFLTPAYVWLLPIEVIAVASAWFWARRRLLEETWGLPAYLSHFLRTLLALGGPWIFLALLPTFVRASSPVDRPSAALIFLGVMLVWFYASHFLLLFLLQARPLARPDLVAPLAAIVARSTVKAPATFTLPCRGRWINAFALPAKKDARVLFTEGLLEHMPADEIAAIFAHEVAHLEHYTPARLRRAGWAALLLAVLGAIGVPALFKLMSDDGWLACLVWAMTIIFGLTLRASRHKRHESESDRRAADLCGDGEALVRALTRLHTLALMPRQWQDDTWVSHPSLSRRIQALRAATSPAPAGPAPSAAFATGPGSWVVFDADRVHWLDGVPADTPADPAALRAGARSARAVMYAELTQLRIDLRRRVPRLVARDRTGRTWAVTLADTDAAAVQTAVDSVDVRLAPLPERRGRSVFRVVAIVAGVLALGPLGLLLLVTLLSRWNRGGDAGAALPAFAWDAASIPMTREVSLPRASYEVRLSPDGTAYAAATNDTTDDATDADDDEREGTRRFRIARDGHAAAECQAWDLAFIDDEHLLRLTFAGSQRWRLDEIDASGHVVGDWSQELPWLSAPRLSVHGPTRRWTLSGTQYRPPRLVTLRGTVGDAEVETRRLDLQKGMIPVAGPDPDRESLGVRLDFDRSSALSMWGLMARVLFGRLHVRSELWRLDASGGRRLTTIDAMLQCYPPNAPGDDFVCLSHEAAGTALWAVNVQSAALRPLGRFPDAGSGAAATARGIAVMTAGSAGIVDPRGGSVARLAIPAGRSARQIVTYDAGVGLVVADSTGASWLTLYAPR